MPSDDYKVVVKADKTPEGQHERWYNTPIIDFSESSRILYDEL